MSFFGVGEVYLNISPAPEKYYLSDTSSAPEKPGKYLKTPFRRRRSIYTHFSGAGEVLIYTHWAPERPEKPEKPEKYLYTPPICVHYPQSTSCSPGSVCGPTGRPLQRPRSHPSPSPQEAT